MGLAFGMAMLAGASHAADSIRIKVESAVVKDQAIPEAKITFKQDDKLVEAGRTDANGLLVASPAPFGGADTRGHIVLIEKEGYSPLAVKCPCDGMTYAISPDMQGLDELRVVLSWGPEPRDLDGHLVFPGNHVFWNHMDGDGVHQDVDHVTGYGPETITILHRHQGEKYLYSVNNYSDTNPDADQSAMATGMRLSSLSDAKVMVYVGQTLIRTYYVPTGQAGTLWNVFMIDEGGAFHDLNTFGAVEAREVGDTMTEALASGNYGSTVAASTFDPERAKLLNKEGERLYHQGDLQPALTLWQEAVNLDPGFAQAYSNLGLGYSKAGRKAEAIWANRKSIDLAPGEDGKVVRASSYYNIARIYEERGQYADALATYQICQSLVPRDAYTSRIAKMKGLLGQH